MFLEKTSNWFSDKKLPNVDIGWGDNSEIQTVGKPNLFGILKKSPVFGDSVVQISDT